MPSSAGATSTRAGRGTPPSAIAQTPGAVGDATLHGHRHRATVRPEPVAEHLGGLVGAAQRSVDHLPGVRTAGLRVLRGGLPGPQAQAGVYAAYDRPARFTYAVGTSNGGYQVRRAVELAPKVFDGGVDWEGTFVDAAPPNLLTDLPPANTVSSSPAAARSAPAQVAQQPAGRTRGAVR